MKKFLQILQIALLVYFGAFLIFFIAFDTLGGLFGMDEITSDSMVKIILTGLIVFLISWAVGYSVNSGFTSKIKAMENDINALKAKIYDFEHPKSSLKPQEPLKKSPDGDSSSIAPRQNIT
jgi:hypothetical protein